MASLEESTSLVQLKVRLLGISPMIWRRLLVPASVSLRELHGILQVSMGCEGIHLCYFDIHAVHDGSFELSTQSPDIALSRFQYRESDRFAYLDDMGDYWEHEVIVLGKGRDRHDATGLSIAEAQAEAFCASRSVCPGCRRRLCRKGSRSIRYRTVFVISRSPARGITKVPATAIVPRPSAPCTMS